MVKWIIIEATLTNYVLVKIITIIIMITAKTTIKMENKQKHNLIKIHNRFKFKFNKKKNNKNNKHYIYNKTLNKNKMMQNKKKMNYIKQIKH